MASLFANPLLARAIAGLAFASALAGGWLYSRPEHLRQVGITDFQDFYVVGKLVRGGRASCAYAWDCLRQAQIREFGHWDFMPWAYPPQATAAASSLALVPHNVAFLVFVAASFALFYRGVTRLAGGYPSFALALVLPAILINLRCGQNGFLVAGLMALFCELTLRRSDRSGLALGALVIKPHLAVACSLFCLLRGRWAALGWAALVAASSGAFATLALGPSIWAAFADGLARSGDAMRAGTLPLSRMTSVYAAAFQLELSPAPAMALQALVACATIAALARLCRSQVQERLVLAFATAAAVLISPYAYDYDMTILAVSLALVAPLVVGHLRGPEAFGLAVLSWLASANFVNIAVVKARYGAPAIFDAMWPFPALCVLGMVLILVRVVIRHRLWTISSG